jgi:hypothetical protein
MSISILVTSANLDQTHTVASHRIDRGWERMTFDVTLDTERGRIELVRDVARSHLMPRRATVAGRPRPL